MSVERTITVGLRVDAIAPIEVAVDLIDNALLTHARFLMTFVNPGTAMIVQREPHTADLFETFDLVAPDGIAMVQTVRLLHRLHGTRISFRFDGIGAACVSLGRKARLQDRPGGRQTGRRRTSPPTVATGL